MKALLWTPGPPDQGEPGVLLPRRCRCGPVWVGCDQKRKRALAEDRRASAEEQRTSAKEQLVLMLRGWYMHPNGRLPAYEYFHGDTGAGLGTSHQTGWTGLIAKILQQSDSAPGGRAG